MSKADGAPRKATETHQHAPRIAASTKIVHYLYLSVLVVATPPARAQQLKTSPTELTTSNDQPAKTPIKPPHVLTLDEDLNRFVHLDYLYLAKLPRLTQIAVIPLAESFRRSPIAKPLSSTTTTIAADATSFQEILLHPIDTSEPRQLGVRRRWKLAKSTTPRSAQEALAQVLLAERARIVGETFTNLQEATQRQACATQSAARWDRLLNSLELHKAIVNLDEHKRAQAARAEARTRMKAATANAERHRFLRAANYNLQTDEHEHLLLERMQDTPRLELPKLEELARLALEADPLTAYYNLAISDLENQIKALDKSKPTKPEQQAAGPLIDNLEDIQMPIPGPRANEEAMLKSNLAELKSPLVDQQSRMLSRVERTYKVCSCKLSELQQAESEALVSRKSLEHAERNSINRPAHINQLINRQVADDAKQLHYLTALTEYRRACLKLNNAVGQRILP